MVRCASVLWLFSLSTEVIKVAFVFNAWSTGLCAMRVCCGRDRLLLVCSLFLCPIVGLHVALASVQETRFDTHVDAIVLHGVFFREPKGGCFWFHVQYGLCFRQDTFSQALHRA